VNNLLSFLRKEDSVTIAASTLDRRSFCGLVAASLAWAGIAAPAFAQSSALDEIRKRGELRIGWGIWVPYMYLDPKTSKTTGVTVAIGNALAEHLGVKAAFVETTWATMVAGLQAKQYDVTMPYIVTEERARVVTFTNPLFRSNWGLMVPKDKVSRYKSWEDLNKPDMRITTTLGSSAPDFLKKLDKAQHLLMKDGSDSIAQLLTGQADAWLSQYDAFRVAQQHQPSLAVVPGPSLGHQDVALAMGKNEMALKKAIDDFFAEAKTSGRLLGMIKDYGLDQTSISS
jgi:ABC-type amino acid transport substrate-binding protein